MNKYNDLDDFIDNWNDTGKDINGIGDVLFDSIKYKLFIYCKLVAIYNFLISNNKRLLCIFIFFLYCLFIFTRSICKINITIVIYW